MAKGSVDTGITYLMKCVLSFPSRNLASSAILIRNVAVVLQDPLK